MSAGRMKEWGGRLPVHGAPCWCNPTVEPEEDGEIVVHNSADGRERYETGERKSS